MSIATARAGTLSLADAPDPLTPPEAAIVARIGVNAIYREIQAGRLYAARIGRSYRIPKRALARLLEGPSALEDNTTG